MQQAVYAGARSFEVRTADPAQPGPGEVQIAVVLHGVVRDGPAHLPRRHGRAGGRATSDRPRDGRSHRRARQRRHRLAGRRSGYRRSARIVRAVSGVPCGAPAHLPPAQLHRDRLDRVRCSSRGWYLRTRWCRSRPGSRSATRRWSNPPRSPCTTSAARSCVPVSRRSIVGGGPVGVLMAVVARSVGAEVVVVEPDAFRRGVAESIGFTTLDPTSDDVARLGRGMDRWSRRGGRLRGVRCRRGCHHGGRRAGRAWPVVPGGDPPAPARGEPASVLLAGADPGGGPAVRASRLREGGRARRCPAPSRPRP